MQKIPKKNIIIGTILLAALGLLSCFIWRNFLQKTPKYSNEYLVSPSTCSYQEKICTKISFDFAASQKAQNQIPKYAIHEFFDKGETDIIFYDVKDTKTQFDYNQVINNPLIQELDYYQEHNNFVVKIKRKGAFLPAQVEQRESTAIIRLNEGDEKYPLVSDQKPADNSAAFPAFRKISFTATLNEPLRKAVVLFQNDPVEFSVTEIAKNKYSFEFNKNIVKDETYNLKVIVTDGRDRTSVTSWSFKGQIPVERILGKDRFKYLGWWGQINSNGVSVRKSPEKSAQKTGELSSINTVKVLKEVYGDYIGESNLWYEIDGGKYSHSYIFSDYVNPIDQPAPPQNFTIPQEVKSGDYWIDVDLTKKVLTLFDYDKPIFATFVSPGRPENPTVEGTFSVWYKLTTARMHGGPPLHSYRYDIPNVPDVLYYHDSYAIHGTFWHDKFGTQQSAGCTNMTQGDAAFIFEKANPKIDPDKLSVVASESNPGTVVHNHY